MKVRSTRPPRPAWLRSWPDGGIEVELIAGEDGVSPGQACVFYDAAEGQARVLGGGIIAGTMAREKRDGRGSHVRRRMFFDDRGIARS